MARLQIGVVDGLHGQASVTHSDGSTETLHSGSLLYADDVITTGPNGLVEITFIDGSGYQIGSDFTTILNNDIFDPAGHTLVSEDGDATVAVTHIGIVTTVDGDVKVVRSDGKTYDLSPGDFLYHDDVIITSDDGSALITMLDGSDLNIGPGFTAHLGDDLFPSQYSDFLSAGITDAETIHAAILEGKDPTELTEAPAAGVAGVMEDEGTTVVRLEATGRVVTPESGFVTTPVGYGFSELDEESLQPQQASQQPPVISIDTSNTVGDSVTEGETLVFSVVLDKPNPTVDVSATWTLSFGAAGVQDLSQLAALTGTVTIPAGETSATIAIPTLDDSIFEGGPGTFEDLVETLSDITNAQPDNITAIGLIEDNDATLVGFTPGAGGSEVTVTEGDPGGPDATIVFTLQLTNPSASAVSVDYTVVPGSALTPGDYNGSLDGLTGTVTFLAGQTSAQVTLM